MEKTPSNVNRTDTDLLTKLENEFILVKIDLKKKLEAYLEENELYQKSCFFCK